VIILTNPAVYPDIVTTKGGDVVVLVMPGISVVYLARVIKDGEGMDTIKERFITSLRTKALAEARAMAEGTGGRVLQWMNGASEPSPWPES
jgi:hypothetical protein